MLRSLLVLLLVVSLAPSARAARIDEQGAQKLGVVFEKFMADRKAMVEADGVTKLTYDGVAVVEPAKGYYAVTLPHTKITYGNGSQFEIGMISINASPHDKEGQWKMTVALPTPLLMNGIHGSLQTKINIGEQRAAGIWDEQLEGFSKLDASYKNIIIENLKYPYTITVPGAQLVFDLTKDEQGFWSGPGHVSFDRLSIVSPPEKLQGRIENIRSDFKLDHYNPMAIKKYQQSMAGLTKKFADRAPAADGVAPVQLKDIYAPLFDFFTTSGNGFEVNYQVSGIDFSWQGRNGLSPGLFKLASGNAGLKLGGFNTNLSSLNLLFGFDGLDAYTKQSGLLKPLTPSTGKVDIALQNIPVKQISALGLNTLNAMADQNASSMAGLAFMLKLPAMLSQSGSVVNIQNNYLSNPEYRIDLNGTAKADIAAVNSVTANAQAAVTNIDRMIALAKAAEKDPDPETAKAAKDLGAQLATIKAYARAEATPGAPTKHIIDLVMDEKGQMLLNGKPMQGLKPPAVKP